MSHFRQRATATHLDTSRANDCARASLGEHALRRARLVNVYVYVYVVDIRGGDGVGMRLEDGATLRVVQAVAGG